MSEREHNHGSGETNAEGGAADPLAPHKNRPAAGASEVHSTQGLGHGWQGESAATDFLGLDESASGPLGFADPQRAGSPAEAVLPAESWLHQIEGSATAVDEGAQAATAAPVNLLDTFEDEALAPAEQAETAARSPAPRARAPRPTRILTFALAGILLALLSGGAWMWRQHSLRTAKTPATDLAVKPPSKAPVAPKTPDRRGAASTPATSSTRPDPRGTGVDPVQPGDPSDPTARGADITPPDLTSLPATDTGAPSVAPTIEFPPVAGPGAEPVAAVTVAVPAPNIRGAFSTPPPSTSPLPGAVRRATEADFAGLWRETSIPTEAIDGDTRLRTLNVGRVRVLLVGGEYYEGTLYAVGERRVWLDLELGRISFESSTVREMTVIASAPGAAPGAPAGGKQKPADLIGLPHVEVHMPGGTVTGRLVGREGNRVTLVTDKGLRTVLESDDVRPVTMRNTRVLGPVAKLDAQADGKNP